MKHLCEACQGLHITRTQVESLRARSEFERTAEKEYFHEWLHPDIFGLKASAEGEAGKRGCHLCTLILRSLKDYRTVGTAKEDSHLLDAPVKLATRATIDKVELVASLGGWDGHPLSLSTESGK
jgi:hypothetical protein